MADTYKVEPSLKAENSDKPDVKIEASASPPALDDDDLYEDAGDLSFYDTNVPAQLDSLSLMRIPRDLWKRWAELNDDQEIQIGTMRIWEEPVKVGNATKNVTRRKMLLDPKIPQHQEVPREYNLPDNDTFDKDGSQYVFAEEDLKGFKDKSRNTGLPLSILRARSERVDKPKWDRNRNRNQVYYRKAIPKKTKVVGRVVHEMTATPIAAEQDKHIVKRQLDDENKEGKIGFISNRHGQMVRNKTTMVSEWDNKFIKSQPKPSKAKKTEMKSVRIPENELMDKIFQCFTQFQYWSLKSLRAQLQQPEAYLRQTLEKIAILNKSGRFANNWSLKPENMSVSQRNAGEVAPETAEGTDAEDEDVEMKMEDAL